MKVLKLFIVFVFGMLLMLGITASTCAKKTTYSPVIPFDTDEITTEDKRTEDANTNNSEPTFEGPDNNTGTASIVYPIADGETTDLCNKGKADLFVLGSETTICGLAGIITPKQYHNYKREGFCDCFNQFCNQSSVQAEAFLDCVSAHKHFLEVIIDERRN